MNKTAAASWEPEVASSQVEIQLSDKLQADVGQGRLLLTIKGDRLNISQELGAMLSKIAEAYGDAESDRICRLVEKELTRSMLTQVLMDNIVG